MLAVCVCVCSCDLLGSFLWTKWTSATKSHFVCSLRTQQPRWLVHDGDDRPWRSRREHVTCHEVKPGNLLPLPLLDQLNIGDVPVGVRDVDGYRGASTTSSSVVSYNVQVYAISTTTLENIPN